MARAKKVKESNFSCSSLSSQIKFYEGLYKKGAIKNGGSAHNRLKNLKAKQLLRRLQPPEKQLIKGE
tara:strand:- start:1066 stop:1266 length:201 start_codon:yes stop_codon:yes gene_type:complete